MNACNNDTKTTWDSIGIWPTKQTKNTFYLGRFELTCAFLMHTPGSVLQIPSHKCLANQMRYPIVLPMNLVKRNASVESFEVARQQQRTSSNEKHSTYSVYKRLANLALAIFTAAICINLWLLSTDKAANWHAQQASQLGRTMVSIGANVIAPALAKKDTDSLQRHIKHLIDDVHVYSATVHDTKGRVITTSRDVQTFLPDVVGDAFRPLIFVEEIRVDGDVIGYLRLILIEQEVMRFHDDYQLQLFEQLIVLMMLAGAGGLLVARAFYKFRYRHYRNVAKIEADEAANAEQTPQQSLKL